MNGGMNRRFRHRFPRIDPVPVTRDAPGIYTAAANPASNPRTAG